MDAASGRVGTQHAASLRGKTVAVTRPAEQAAGLIAALRDLAADVIVAPLIQVVVEPAGGPLDAALGQLASYGWLLVTSANAARAVGERLLALGIGRPVGLRVGAVGAQTAAVLRAHRLPPDLVPERETAGGLLAALPEVRNVRLLLPGSSIGRDELATGLLARGGLPDAVVAYRTLPADGATTLLPLLRAATLDAVTLASPSAFHSLLDGLRVADALETLRSTRLVCIGGTTAAAVRVAGYSVAAVATTPGDAGLAQAVVRALG